MLIAKVVGRVVATRKDDKLVGSKLLVVKPMGASVRAGDLPIVAVDTVGAGIGEEVLVATGSAARLAAELVNCPVDAAIIGIIDSKEL